MLHMPATPEPTKIKATTTLSLTSRNVMANMLTNCVQLSTIAATFYNKVRTLVKMLVARAA